ncbi:hypothetical protein ACWE42_25410 [Sutcliffiella cohnii]
MTRITTKVEDEKAKSTVTTLADKVELKAKQIQYSGFSEEDKDKGYKMKEKTMYRSKNVNDLRSMTDGLGCGETILAINKAIQDAESLEERLELLVFKCEVLEFLTFGKVFNP